MSQQAAAAHPRGWRFPRFGLSDQGHVWAAWAIAAVMFAAAAIHIWRFGFTFPYRDEMEWVPVLVGDQPVTFSWLWSQHSEHRMLLPRLLYVSITRLTGGNLSHAALYNAIVLAAVSGMLMWVARRLRGSTRLCDAFFPLAFLHWGHFTNLLWDFQLNFVTAVALTCVVLTAISLAGRTLSLRRAGLISACLVLMVLCGAYGMAYAPTMSLWLALAAVTQWRQAESFAKVKAVALLCLAAAPVAAVGIYFYGYVRPTVFGDAELWPRLRTALETLSTALGPAARQIWPLSGIVMLLGLALGIAGLVWLWRTQPVGRLRTAGLFCFLGGALVLMLGIGWGRGVLGPNAGFTDRYILLATPVLALWYLQAVLAGEGLHARRVQVALFTLMCVLLTVNTRKGYRAGADFHSRFVALENDIRAGLSCAGLACRHAYIYPSEEILCARLESLRRIQFGAFAEVDPQGPLRDVEVAPLEVVPQWNETSGKIRLTAGERLHRRFRVPAGRTLQRIDIQASRYRVGRMPASLNWALYRRVEDQPQQVCSGQVDLQHLQNERFIQLLCPVPVDGDCEFELELAAPDSLPDGLYAEFPTFQSQRSAKQELNVFYFTQSRALAQKPAATRR